MDAGAMSREKGCSRPFQPYDAQISKIIAPLYASDLTPHQADL